MKGSISAELGRRESSAYGGGEEEHECGEDLNTGARGSGPFDGLKLDWEEVDLPEACDRHNKGKDVCYYRRPVGEEPWRDGRFGGKFGGFIEAEGN